MRDSSDLSLNRKKTCYSEYVQGYIGIRSPLTQCLILSRKLLCYSDSVKWAYESKWLPIVPGSFFKSSSLKRLFLQHSYWHYPWFIIWIAVPYFWSQNWNVMLQNKCQKPIGRNFLGNKYIVWPAIDRTFYRLSRSRFLVEIEISRASFEDSVFSTLDGSGMVFHWLALHFGPFCYFYFNLQVSEKQLSRYRKRSNLRKDATSSIEFNERLNQNSIASHWNYSKTIPKCVLDKITYPLFTYSILFPLEFNSVH